LNPAKDLGIHRLNDAAGLRVLLAGVVDAEQAERTRNNFCLGTMRKLEKRARSNGAALLQKLEGAVPSDFSQRENRFGPQDFKLVFKINAAARNFSERRFVVRRRATASGDNVGVGQLQSIVAMKGSKLIREARFVERRV